MFFFFGQRSYIDLALPDSAMQKRGGTYAEAIYDDVELFVVV